MKRPLLATLLFAPLLSLGQTFYYIDQITVAPAAPTTSDPITITLIGNLSSSNSYIISANHSIVGNQVTITVAAGSSGIGLPVLTPHNEVFNIGMLPAGTYTIVINGISILDGAPAPQHQFVVSGGGSACDSVIVDYVQWAPFSDTAVEVHVYNNSSVLFDYPGWILFDALGDTLAMEVVNFFGIAGESWHTLSIHPGAVIPTGTFSGTLELWTGFYTDLQCTFSWTGVRPPAPCVTIYPGVSGSAIPAIGTIDWTLLDDIGGGTVGGGTFVLDSANQYVVDSVCAPPGSYTLSLNNTAPLGGAVYFWAATTNPWAALPSQPFTQDGVPDLLPFLFYEHCIDSTNVVAEGIALQQLIAWADEHVIHILSGTGTLGTVEILGSDGRRIHAGVVMGSELVFPTSSLAPGIYLVRSSALAATARVLVR